MPPECPRLNDIDLGGMNHPLFKNNSTGRELEGKNEERGAYAPLV